MKITTKLFLKSLKILIHKKVISQEKVKSFCFWICTEKILYTCKIKMVKTLSFYEKNNVSEIKKNNINMTQATCINADKYNNFQC